jgi:hypothetical protein
MLLDVVMFLHEIRRILNREMGGKFIAKRMSPNRIKETYERGFGGQTFCLSPHLPVPFLWFAHFILGFFLFNA